MKIELPVIEKAKLWKKNNLPALKRLKISSDLDIKFQEAHDQVFSEINCLDCANCCRTTGPLFTQKDIQRISKHLGLKPGDFIQQYLLMDEDGDFVLQTLPCPFLQHDSACGIYEQRPQACRQYPHTDQKGQSKIFDLTLKNMEICPAASEIVKRII